MLLAIAIIVSWISLNSEKKSSQVGINNQSSGTQGLTEWKLYENTRSVPFRFKYPPEWNLVNNDKSVIDFSLSQNNYEVLRIQNYNVTAPYEYYVNAKTFDPKDAHEGKIYINFSPQAKYVSAICTYNSNSEILDRCNKVIASFEYFYPTGQQNTSNDWRTIKSGDGKFEIQYPQGWYANSFSEQLELSNQELSDKPLKENQVIINVDTKIISNLTPDDITDFYSYLVWSAHQGGVSVSFVKTNIASHEAYKTNYHEGDINVTVYAIDMENGNYIWITYYGVNQEQQVNQILSTLKFTK